MNSQQRAACEAWEQLIVDGKTIKELPNFNPDLMMRYWEAEGFRRDALEPLRRGFSEWFKRRGG